MHSYSESKFRKKVQSALTAVNRILHVSRHPSYPADLDHQYDDKYLLAEFVTNVALAAALNCLELLGLDEKGLAEVTRWAQDRSVTLRLTAQETCTFKKKKERKEETPMLVTESKGVLGKVKTTQKIVEKVEDYYWDFQVRYEIFLFRGNDVNTKVVLKERTGGCVIITHSDLTPYPQSTVTPETDVNITWFLSQIQKEKFRFGINRSSEKCRTPRRNPEIEAAFAFFQQLTVWSRAAAEYFTGHVFPAQKKHDLDISRINDVGVFVPVLPLFDDSSNKTKPDSTKEITLAGVVPSGSSLLLSAGDVNLFLGEQRRSFEEKFAGFDKMFPDDKQLITHHEARIVSIFVHLQHVAEHFSEGIDSIEAMLRSQLVAAIGEEVTARDFDQYMLYHYRKIFRPEFQPKPFSYAVRQPGHDLEGVIEISDGGSPIYTLVRHSKAKRPIKFSICAGTEVSFLGDRYVHTLVRHQFSFTETRDTPTELTMNARARQFSCFVLMIGTMGGADVFEPKHAIIIKNKDDLKIPLLLEQLPTPQEFKDAIESLSPEQQRFAKAYRSMQLAGTLFAVCLVQIRPQLERVLNLPHDSLTKEVVLTQELMELFMEYQIPSDLLRYDGKLSEPEEAKVENVRGNAAKVRRMINAAKARKAEEDRQRRELERIEREKREREEREERERLARLEREMLVQESMCLSDTFSDNFRQEKICRPQRKDMKCKEKKSVLSKNRNFAVLEKQADFCADLAPPLIERADKIAEKEIAQKPAEKIPEKEIAQKAEEKIVETPVEDKPANDQTSKSTPEETQQQDKEVAREFSPDDDEEEEDYTKIPSELESKYSELDEDNALRPTTIKVGSLWSKEWFQSLLSPSETTTLQSNHLEDERRKVFDLLDALSRSGALSFGDHVSLHVMICATNGFDRSIIDTLVQDNVNPIEKMERSLLIVATTVQKKPAELMIKEGETEKVRTYAPKLFSLPSLSLPSTKGEDEKAKGKSKGKGKAKEKQKVSK
eukprot:TRINITY_DN533_c0_g2_i1.p1 TRINITY_DN533_c0_g2~~TRINITY_DN533_c0_g2_i1.p1  ORF type:complete len:999 (-),score=241.59 TRINITY_DN533_c0_g2_i1:48-3044(-)